ncbi:hypothetical protein ASE16_02710 [Leifsonia sp. Root227]|uniref:helix-turn-helix transcriptional regulator n=1 Tax=Leifsonia sp. Root227 TaxID=1736496 RepID=UPI0006FE8F71|nr:helix-turn-helix transcriptional regulator [Leifsonia sp. Root227]KRC51995.1 hypothetical protein ASE16_02710 [Leifsonia sp. Root227]
MSDDNIQDVTEQLIRNVNNAIGDASLTEISERAGLSERRLAAILERRQTPDLADIRALENALDTDLWP